MAISETLKQFQVSTPSSYGSRQRRWSALQVFNYYRLFIALLIPLLNTVDIGVLSQSQRFPLMFSVLCMIYFVFACLMLLLTQFQSLRINNLVLLQGLFDLFLLTLLIYTSHGISSGLGILLNISVAGVSILLPGQMSLFFAALATLFLIVEQMFAFFAGFSHASAIFMVGVHGVGFFATAMTALALSKRLQHSEALANLQSINVESLEKLNEYIIQRLHAGIIVVDSAGQIQSINDAAKKMLDISALKPLKHISDASDELAQRLFDWKKHPYLAVKPISPQGVSANIIINFSQLHSGNQHATLIALDDMTRMTQHAQQLKLASLGKFTASIAHELRNPLGAISHAAQLLSESQQNADSEQLVAIIRRHTDRMNSVIKNILQLSRQKKNSPEQFAILPWIQRFAEDFKSSCNQEMTLTIDGQPEDLQVFMDKSHLEQILTVLLDNSAKHGKPSEQPLKITLTIGVLEEKQLPYIDIADQGSGIDPEILQHIFEPFYTTSRSGTGLGLYIAKELCEFNQANLEYCQGRSGACFRISFYTEKQSIL